YELFSLLKENSCKIAIATTDKTERAELVMDFLGLKDQTDFIIGADLVKKGKPAPDMVNFILKRLAIDRGRAVMIGDALTDIQMGINARLKASIAVLSGLASESELKKLTPHIIKSIETIRVE
ncbi:HAD family hydrolase, partial [Candidatus Omnitrophota bacterium]